MSDDPHDTLEGRLRAAAHHFRYPPTPDIVAMLRERANPQRRARLLSPAQAAFALLIALGALLLATPQARAAVLEALRIGVVRIVPAATVLPAAPAATGMPLSSPTPARPVPDPLRQLYGATTLEQARARAPFVIKLPSEPPDLGPPDEVFVQTLGGPTAIVVWRMPGDPARLRLALYILSNEVFAQKMGVPAIKETTVRGQPAVWASGPYFVQIGVDNGAELAERRLVTGNTLIWAEGELTYRLETGLPLEQALQIAESLR